MERCNKKIQTDPLLSRYVKKLPMKINSGTQNVLCLDIKCIDVWLSKINFKTLTKEQYGKIVDIINYLSQINFTNTKYQSNIYDFESHLRDELFSIGHFDNIKIVDKEVIYNFGRIDLLGIDEEGNQVCIELKRYKEFNDTKEQLLKYKHSNVFSRIIYCAYSIDDDFKEWCKVNNIDTYIYKRELKMIAV